jgi:hypothetical protein
VLKADNRPGWLKGNLFHVRVEGVQLLETEQLAQFPDLFS